VARTATTETTKTTAGARGLGTPFRLLFTASTGSNLGDGVLLAAVPLLARRLSDDPLAVSSVTVAATLPWLLFGLAAGAIVDRTDRRRAMVRTDVVRCAGLAVFALAISTGSPSLAVVIATVFLVGAAETIFDTAAQAVLPTLVATDRLERANGRLFGAQTATNGFVGPPMGALLFAAGTALPFAVDAATFGFSAVLLFRLPRPGFDRPATSTSRRTTLRQDVGEGLAWLWRHDGVRAFAIGAAVVNLAHTAAMAVAVILVRDELGGSELAFGFTLAGAAAGSVAGSLLAASIVERAGRRRAVLGAIVAFALSLLWAGLAPNAFAAALGLAAFGLAGEVWNVVAVSYRQARVPGHLLGRVMATYRVIAYGAMPVGAAIGGAIATAAGVRATFVAGAAGVALLLLYFRAPTRAEHLI
jgi:MFS family permease